MGRKNRAEIRKPQILDHFYQVLVKEGLQNASIARIARHMNVPPSLLLHYFKSKEEMISDLMKFILQKYGKATIKSLRSTPTPERRLSSLLDIIFGLGWMKTIDQRAFYACYYLSLSDHRINEIFYEQYTIFKDRLAKQIHEWLNNTKKLPEQDYEKLAYFILALMEGLIFLRNIIDDEKQYQEIGQYMKESVLNILERGTGKT